MGEAVVCASEASYRINVSKTEIREGHNLGDAERVLAAYSDRFIDMTAGQPSFGGSEAKVVLRARLEHLFARNHVKFVPLTMGIKVFGDFAIAYGWNEITLVAKSGEPDGLYRKRFMELWRKEGDGVWRIAIQIDNEDQPAVFVEQALAALAAEALSRNG